MAYRRTDSETDDLIRSAYLGGHSALSIAVSFGVSLHLVLDRLRETSIGIRQVGREPVSVLNLGDGRHQRLMEVVDGLMLGDGSISQSGVLRLEQSVVHGGWVYQVRDMLAKIGIPTRIGSQPPRTVKIGNHFAVGKGSIFVYTPVYREFKQQRVRWYPDSKKRIPKDLVLTPVSLALWLCGDGGNQGNGLLKFSTNGFLESDLDYLIGCLRHKFNICVYKVRSGKTVSGRQTFCLFAGRRNDSHRIKLLVEQYVPPVFTYKLYGIRPAIPRGRALRRLVESQVVCIRQRHNDGETMAALGREFGVSNVTISNIVHRRVYKDVL